MKSIKQKGARVEDPAAEVIGSFSYWASEAVLGKVKNTQMKIKVEVHISRCV